MGVRFDAYSATTQACKAQDLVQLIVDVVPLSTGWTIHQGKGFHTFGERIAFRDQSGSEFASVQWGGRQGERAMIEVKGENTPGTVEALRSRFPHRCTRVDACADFDAPGAFEALLGPCLEVKKEYRLKGSKLGDWEDFPEEGRTLYLGSPSSVSRVRLYEKGKQKEYRHLDRVNWARIEAQVRPAKEAKTEYAKLSPLEVWGASGWTRALAGRVLEQHIDPHPAGSTYRLTETEAALRWMCRQYGAHLLALKEEVGSWECVGLTLREMLKESQQ